MGRSQRLSTRMIESVKETVNGVFRVLSDDLEISNEEKKYTVVFGDQETFCSCTCRDFRRTRLLCKDCLQLLKVMKSNFTIYHNFSEIIILQIWTMDCLKKMKYMKTLSMNPKLLLNHLIQKSMVQKSIYTAVIIKVISRLHLSIYNNCISLIIIHYIL